MEEVPGFESRGYIVIIKRKDGGRITINLKPVVNSWNDVTSE